MLDLAGLSRAKSVRVGALSHPAADAERVLHRYCKHIFVLNDSDEYPYSFRGSGAAIRFGAQHLMFCTSHQFSDLEPDRIAIVPSVARTKTITASTLHVTHPHDPADDGEYLDVRAFEFRVEKYDIPNLTSDFFSIDETSLWPSGSLSTHRFFVFGFPFKRQSVDFDTPRIDARVVAVGATYDGKSAADWVHRIRMDRREPFDPDGMSGGPVFYLGRRGADFFMGFAGIVVRGSASSELLHFIEAGFLRHFADIVPAGPITR